MGRRRTIKSNRARMETYLKDKDTAESIGASSAGSHIDFEDLSEILAPLPYSPEPSSNNHRPIDTSNSLQYWSGGGATPPSTFSSFHFENYPSIGSSSLEYPHNGEPPHFRTTLPNTAPVPPSDLTPPYSEGLGINELHRLGDNQEWFSLHGRPPSETASRKEAADRPLEADQSTPPTYRSTKIAEDGKYIQQLSELNQSLYLQLKALGDDSWACCLPSLSLISGSNSGTSTEADATKPVGDILSSSEKFVVLMSKFLPPKQPPEPLYSMPTSVHAEAPKPPDTSLSNSNKRVKDKEVGDSRSVKQSAELSEYDSHPGPNSVSLLPIDISPRLGQQFPLCQLDIPTILLILSCYIRMASIYAKLFSHINKYLSLASSNDSSLPKYSPGPKNSQSPPDFHARSPLQIGGFSLHSYGNIQIKILVEISVHFVTRIEGILGVPRRYRLKNDCWNATQDDTNLAGREENEDESRNSEEGSSCTESRIRSLLDIVTMVVELDGNDVGSGLGGGVMGLREEFMALQKRLKRIT
ncbi:uncharacterized protein BP5553_06489 [Venustampulla echinocandica]|uniref:Uncharacterized protein n=1 Tax=Venustampulla echinocandica TaxID=2656787 RepID=A0A370TK39_9HELO|nr:uncharacterized protein BP5553_06489 [Venustampulla echinocandica]RDL35877.1 hypothetical protein BP5553_06489 [Venustampulla echinocandica]